MAINNPLIRIRRLYMVSLSKVKDHNINLLTQRLEKWDTVTVAEIGITRKTEELALINWAKWYIYNHFLSYECFLVYAYMSSYFQPLLLVHKIFYINLYIP